MPSESYPAVMEAAPSVVPLGNYGKFAATGLNPGFLEVDERLHILRERFALQATARKLIGSWHGVQACMVKPIPVGGRPFVSLCHDVQHQRGVLRNLQICKSPWVCPICVSIISERRRIQIENMNRAARRKGLRVVMVTLTFSHHRGDDLAVILDAFLEALRYLTSLRGFKRLRAEAGQVGWVRALECTHGDNGWHPHAHLLVYLAPGADTAAYAERFASLWSASLARFGLSCNEHGFKLDDTDDAAAQYLAKWGHDRGWNESAELTKSHVKHGRENARSVFDLLRAAAAGDELAGQLFAEFARVFKGRSQLQTTRGLVAGLIGEDEKTDDELIDESEADAVLLAVLLWSGWKKVLAQDARAELVRSLDTGDLSTVLECLDGLGVSPDEILCELEAIA